MGQLTQIYFVWHILIQIDDPGNGEKTDGSDGGDKEKEKS